MTSYNLGNIKSVCDFIVLKILIEMHSNPASEREREMRSCKLEKLLHRVNAIDESILLFRLKESKNSLRT